MRFILSLFFNILALQISLSQEISTNEYKIRTHLNDFNLKGNVEKVVSTVTDSKGNLETLPFKDHEFYNQILLEFNRKGLLTKQTNFLDYRGKLGIYSYVEYYYNSSAQLAKQMNTIINNGEDPKRTAYDKTFIYNDKNQLIKLDEKVEGKSSKTSYETDFVYTANQLLKIVTKIEKTKTSENILTYNKDGFVVLDEMISFDGKKGKKSYFMYDKDTPIFKEEVTGNSNTVTFFDHGSVSKFQSFDTNGNLKYEAVFNSKNEIQSIKHQSFSKGQSELITYTIAYDYDSKGNWILAKVSSVDGELKYRIDRKIAYL